MYRYFFKRIIDITISLVLLIVLFPLIIVIGIILYNLNDGTIIFKQLRPGKNKKAFNIFKFKSMSEKKDSDGNLLSDKLRLTKFGKFIRNTSLDEIPQLINVLKGDMSLIGPRPLLFKYLSLYSVEQDRRHELRPGITGWAQVNGRNTISWTEKFRHDVYYVERVSFLLDLKIFWLTFLKVVKKEGVNQSSERPMEPFNGNN